MKTGLKALLGDLRSRILRCATGRRRRVPDCVLCCGGTELRTGYGRPFAECGRCGLILALDCDGNSVTKGMGMIGSWSGPGGGGYREYFLVRMLMKDLGKNTFLLYGTGATPTFGRLRREGVDVVGCDISEDVIQARVAEFGPDSFVRPEELQAKRKFDGIVAVEVFEHFVDPKRSMALLVDHLNEGGIICGTTNFHPGGPIEDSNDPGYMSSKSHVVYWSEKSLSFAASTFGLAVSLFEMIRPGSVLPDEKYGQLWPEKRVFFLYGPGSHRDYFQELKRSTPILPIDRP